VCGDIREVENGAEVGGDWFPVLGRPAGAVKRYSGSTLTQRRR
jgi:hypothetical protein